MNPDPPLICVIGPTASGKSALAEALAERHQGELISMDSAQVYRGMDVGTAKPSRQVRERIPHHLLDLLDPAQSYSAASFAADARRVVGEIRQRGHLPIVVGGTFLYLRALLQGLHEMPAADAALRQEIERLAAKRGWPALHQELQERDPEAARRIHPTDAQRIQRALEVAHLSGRNRTQCWEGQRTPPWQGPVLKLAIVPQDRALLRQQIAVRFEQMMNQGFLDEVRSLYARPDLNPDLPAIRSVGYRQLWAYLARECELGDAVQRGIIATRQYAKRQMTWLRRETGLQLLSEEPRTRLQQAEKQLEHFLAAHCT